MKSSSQFWVIFAFVMISSILISALSLYAYRENMVDSRKREIASILHFSRAQALVYVDKHKRGLITKEEAEGLIVEALSVMNADTRYIWANDHGAIARVHVRPEVLGKFQSSYVNHMKLLKDKEIAFISKTNVKPISNKRVLKVNGVVKIPDWNWVIGYGAYMDDLEEEFLGVAIKTMLINGLIAVFAAMASLLVMRYRAKAELAS